MAKIMLVEDDTNLSEIYQARLQAEGYQIVSAHDGEQALALAAKEKPDLIISDVMMPKISGFEMLDILRNTADLKNAKVIMLTALGQAEDKTRAEGLGADRYLVKSQVTLEDIVKAAQELLASDGKSAAPTPAITNTPPAPSAPTASPLPPATGGAPMGTPAATAPVAAPIAPAGAPTPGVSVPATQTAAPATSSPSMAPAHEPVVANMPVATPPSETPANAPVSPPTTVATSAPEVNTPASATPPTPAPPVAAPVAMPAPSPTPVQATPTATTLAEPISTPSTPQAAPTISAADALASATNPIANSTPSPTPALPSENTTAAADDKVVSDAVKELVSSAPTPAPEVPAVTSVPTASAPSTPEATQPAAAQVPPAAPSNVVPPEAAVSDEPTLAEPTETTSINGDNVSVAHKKVIKPIDNPNPKPDLNSLLAAEEQRNPGSTSAFGSAQSNVASHPSAPPATMPHQPGNVFTPTPTGTNQATPGVDPNSIAL